MPLCDSATSLENKGGNQVKERIIFLTVNANVNVNASPLRPLSAELKAWWVAQFWQLPQHQRGVVVGLLCQHYGPHFQADEAQP